MASIDEHMLTGESRPAEKSVGEAVFASTLVLAGRIFVRIEKTGHATVAAQIGDLLKDTSGIAMSGQLRGQALSDLYAPPTLGLGLLALPVAGIEAALAVLVSGIAGNMRLLGPISVLSFLQKSARRGILIKDGRALEQFSQIDTVVFDKTGTLTMKQPALGEIHPAGVYSEDILLAYAAAAEHRQTHPIAIAIREAAQARGLELPAISEAAYEIGYGIKVNVDGRLIRVGSDRFMAQEAIFIPPHILDLADAAHSQGHTLIYVGIDGLLGGMIEMCPSVRPEARRVINYLRKAGMDVVVLSGDHEKPTRVLAEQLGITHYFAETLPEQKAEHIARMQGEGRFVCFVGDGINDSIALKKAQVSISLSGASAIATDTAQIILMDKTLNRLDELFELASAFESSIHRDLLTSALPGAVIVGGAFAGSVNLATAFALLWLGSIAGLANALSPALASGADTSRKPH
jgi:Cu2+-exporting ATPase